MLDDNLNKNFITQYLIENESVVDGLLSLFNNSPKNVGVVIQSDGTAVIDKKTKDSTNVDIGVPTSIPEIVAYFHELKKAIDQYNKAYEFSNFPWQIYETFTIQKYEPQGGYFSWHSERVSPNFPMVARHLVFMTYLNDVNDQGETEFYYQNIKIKPKKGLTIIWPSQWTHTHRGIASPTQEKIIISGWLGLR